VKQNLDELERFGEDGIMNKQTMASNEYATLAELGLQRAERFALQLSIEVCGFDRCGRFFTERSETCDTSDGGCKFYLRTEVDREAVVALRVIERYDQRGDGAATILFQVSNTERGSNGWTLGALKLRAEDSCRCGACTGGVVLLRSIDFWRTGCACTESESVIQLLNRLRSCGLRTAVSDCHAIHGALKCAATTATANSNPRCEAACPVKLRLNPHPSKTEGWGTPSR
jgi:hypothetical protein